MTADKPPGGKRLGTMVRGLLLDLLMVAPLALLDPVLAQSFVNKLFGLVSVTQHVHGWWVGLVAGLAGLAGLGLTAQGVAWMGFCSMLGTAVTTAARCADPDLSHHATLVNYAAIQLVGLGWIALILLVSKRTKPAFTLKAVVALYGIANVGVALLQLVVCRIWGVQAAADYALLNRALYVREGGTVFSDAVRLAGLFNNPNTLGCALLVAWPAAVAWQAASAKARLVQTVLPFAAGLVIAATYSRAAYLGLGAQVVLLAFVFWRGRNARRPEDTGGESSRVMLFVAIALILGFCAGLAQPRVNQRVASMGDMSDASIANRLTVYREALAIAAERPLQGHGIGSFYSIYNRFHRPPHLGYHYMDVHSSVLHALLELGLLGVLVFALAVCGLRRPAVYPARGGTAAQGGFWCLLALAGAFFPLMFDNFSVIPGVFVPLLFLFGHLAMAAREREAADPPRNGVRLVQTVAVVLLVAAWYALGTVSPKSFHQRLEESLARTLKPIRGQVAWMVKDDMRCIEAGRHGRMPMTGGDVLDLALAAAARDRIDSGQLDAATSVTLIRSAKGMGNGPLDTGGIASLRQIELEDCVRLMLQYDDRVCANSLLALLGAEAVTSHSAGLFDSPVALPLRFGGGGDTTQNQGSLTPRQLCGLMEHVLAPDLSGSATGIGAALKGNTGAWVVTRHLRGLEGVYSRCGALRSQRAAVVTVASGKERWTASVIVDGLKEQSAGMEDDAWQALADFVHRCHTALEVD